MSVIDRVQESASASCDHFYVTHIRGGEPVSVGICTLCGEIDWADLRSSIEALTRQAEI